MREIKCKAWDKVNKAMRDVWSITWNFKPGEPKVIICCNPVINSEYALYEGQFELLEYTGKHDKNGNEIHEGFINQDKGVCIWNKDDASFCWEYERVETMPFEDEENWCEIIGNIYENPELLSGSNAV